MEPSATSPGTRHWPDWILISLFFVFLILPILDMGFHLDPTLPPNENRLLATFPPAPKGISGLQNFLGNLEVYINDNFGFRRCLVKWNNKLKWSLFRAKDTRDTLVGTEGWMYLSSSQLVEHFRGTLRFTEPELAAWQKLLEHRRDWFAKHGIKYLFVIAPDKQSVYPEYLPDWLKNLGGRTKLDQFLDYMRAHSTVEVLDLRPVLREKKASVPVYQKTDTHWNQLGAFFSYQKVMDALTKQQLPKLAPMPLAAFTYTNQLAPGGDLARMLGVNMMESNAFFLSPKSELPKLETYEPGGKQLKDMAFVKNSDEHGRAVIYQDSFGRYWIPFLGYHFKEVDFFWQYNLDAMQIGRPQPVVVINEMLERYFNLTDPKKLLIQDVLP